MGHPKLDNKTPFTFEPIFIADEDLRPVVVTLVKATYGFDLEGSVWLEEEQLPVNFSGERWSDDSVASYKYEPEVAWCKTATDVALIGHAYPPAKDATQVDVGIKVGPVQKVARVFGDRFWVWNNVGVRISRTASLEPVPLIWENAFGGRDHVNSTPEHPIFEPRNPIGTGFGTPLMKDGDLLRLPNIENPNELIREYGSPVLPCGFGFTSPDWQPRAALAGTYDEQWDSTRKPMLPIDFDPRFFNAAAPDLVADGFLSGREDVVLLNVTPKSRVAFTLPAVPEPMCRVVTRSREDIELKTNLDTVIVNTDQRQLILLWRAYTLIAGGPHDVTAIAVTAAN